MMTEAQKTLILKKAEAWFQSEIADRHIINVKTLNKIEKFTVNPFLMSYLANFLEGNNNYKSLAKALIYPRALGTSINTTFGNSVQKFTSEVLEGFGSTTSGIDIEFIDQLDSRKKYCQVKSGPNTINKDDVETIAGHFKDIRNLARTNNLDIRLNDLIVGVVYGTPKELSGHYKRITNQYDFPVFIGEDFWLRLTGDSAFYKDLIAVTGKVAQRADFKKELENVIEELAEDLRSKNIK